MSLEFNLFRKKTQKRLVPKERGSRMMPPCPQRMISMVRETQALSNDSVHVHGKT